MSLIETVARPGGGLDTIHDLMVRDLHMEHAREKEIVYVVLSLVIGGKW